MSLLISGKRYCSLDSLNVFIELLTKKYEILNPPLTEILQETSQLDGDYLNLKKTAESVKLYSQKSDEFPEMIFQANGAVLDWDNNDPSDLGIDYALSWKSYKQEWNKVFEIFSEVYRDLNTGADKHSYKSNHNQGASWSEWDKEETEGFREFPLEVWRRFKI